MEYEGSNNKKRKKKYVFSPQELILKKRHRVIYTIKTEDIRMIMYNDTFHGLELLVTLITSGIAPAPMPPHLFCIVLKKKNKLGLDKVKRWWIHPKHIKAIQEVKDVPIGFYEPKKCGLWD